MKPFETVSLLSTYFKKKTPKPLYFSALEFLF